MTPKAREMLESGKGAMNADGRWTCLECNRSLSNEWTLEQHIQTVHGARTFNCDVSLHVVFAARFRIRGGALLYWV